MEEQFLFILLNGNCIVFTLFSFIVNIISPDSLNEYGDS